MAHMLRTFLLWIALTASGASAAFTIDTATGNVTSVTGLWWNAAESGWGATLTQQSNIVFVSIFTYEGAGVPTWYVASTCTISNDHCTGDLFRVTGGRGPVSSWAGSNVSASGVGKLTITFTDYNNATMDMTINGVGGSKRITRNIFASSAPPPPPAVTNKSRTEQLVAGTWTYAYVIINNFSNRYTFTSVQESTSTPGDWFASGTGEFGDLVVGGYISKNNYWSVLDPGTIIDRFFVFTFSDLNHVSGCYYQINPPGSTNFSSCYSMAGLRTPAKTGALRGTDTRLQEQSEVGTSVAPADPAILLNYLEARAVYEAGLK